MAFVGETGNFPLKIGNPGTGLSNIVPICRKHGPKFRNRFTDGTESG